jgi:hypothetical protein
MKIRIPEAIFSRFHAHLFQGDLEQGAFLFGNVTGALFTVDDIYVVPPEGWDVQLDVYLEMKDAERAKIMQMAARNGASVIDCHSHPGAGDDVWFSPSDISGITNFAAYAKWKLRGAVYVATVWGESSVDAVCWSGDYGGPERVEAVDIAGRAERRLVPRGSWFREPRAYRRKDGPSHGRG